MSSAGMELADYRAGMDILLSERAGDRIEKHLTEIVRQIRIMRLGTSGKVAVDGSTIPDRDVNPEVAWISMDTFEDGQFDRVFDLLENSARAKWLQTIHAGVDAPHYAALLERKVRVTRSNAQAPAVADYVLANVLAYFQNMEQRRSLQLASQWKGGRTRELSSTRWLIVGLGSIGTEVARRVHAFGAATVGIRRSAVKSSIVDEQISPTALIEHLPHADVVVLSCPLATDTRDLVDKNFIAAMKPGSVLVNVGRGQLIDEVALVDGLKEGRPARAVLDVFREEPLPASSPLWALEGVRITAHCAFDTDSTITRNDELFLKNLDRYCNDRALLHEVR